MRGAHGFGLKAMSKAMHKSQFGHDAMDRRSNGRPRSHGRGVDMSSESSGPGMPHAFEDLDLMQEVRAYNQTDCKAMQDVLKLLRSHH